MQQVQLGFNVEQIIKEGRVTREEINQITSWCPGENLPRLTDEQAALFLLSGSNNVEATKSRIRCCYKICTEAPDISANRNFSREDLQKQFKVWPIYIVPEKTDDGSAVVGTKVCDTNYRNFNMPQLMTLVSMSMDAVYYDYPPTGVIVVFDMKGLGILHLTRLTFRLARIFFEFAQEGFPLKLKEVHMLNTIYFLDKALALLRPFIHNTFFEMLYFHPCSMDMDDFMKKWVPKRCLPEDYGGDAPQTDVLAARLTEKFEQMRPYFEAEGEQRRVATS